MLCFPGQGSVLCTNMYWYLSRYFGRKSLLSPEPVERTCLFPPHGVFDPLEAFEAAGGLGARATYAPGDVRTGLRAASRFL